ncbi:DUF333 domain-containing protein [Acetobacteraceae bacterium]|nr:DUF333 domain-containing protein [Acetobacteraceae bacterium]
MNKFLIVFIAMGLGACAHHSSTREKTIGHPNPAASYCLEQKGSLELKKDSQGNVIGYCHLKSGKIIEEWNFFRQSH